MIQRNVMDSETELLQRIEKAISRMDDSPYRDNLIAKYWAISNGAKYQLTNVAPLLIGRVGGCMATQNIGTHGRKIKCKPDTRSDDELMEVIGWKLSGVESKSPSF